MIYKVCFISSDMELFAHFRNDRPDLSTLLKTFPKDIHILGANRSLDDPKLKLRDVITISTNIFPLHEEVPKEAEQQAAILGHFRQCYQRLVDFDLAAVSDRTLFDDMEHRRQSCYWANIYEFITACLPRVQHVRDSLSALLDKRTGQYAYRLVKPQPYFNDPADLPLSSDESWARQFGEKNAPARSISSIAKEYITVGLEYPALDPSLSLSGLLALEDDHRSFLGELAIFIQYLEVSKTASARRDPKVAVPIDEILALGYDLLHDAAQHHAFTDFIHKIMERDDQRGASFYDTLAFLESSIVVARDEFSHPLPKIPEVFAHLHYYGRSGIVIEKLQQLAARYDDIPAAQLGSMFEAKYSEAGLLQALVKIGQALPANRQDSDLDKVVRLMLKYGNLESYTHSKEGRSAQDLLIFMNKAGFAENVFLADQRSSDVLYRRNTDMERWSDNVDELIKDLALAKYTVFFMRYEAVKDREDTHGGKNTDHGEREALEAPDREKEVLDQRLRDKVLSMGQGDLRFPGGFRENLDVSYALNKVKGLLLHCRTRQKDKRQRGKKMDQPLVELEERLESLEIQLEFGARPTGGKLYSRIWHRSLEDFSTEAFMHCCAALGGDKQDLTFAAVYNPAYVYLTHFIKGIDSQLGFSILKAGFIDHGTKVYNKKVLLAVSPYEANPAIRTALGEAETYRYVLDAMVKTAHSAQAQYLLIDDIDLKVRDEQGQAVRHNNGEFCKVGEQGYETAADLVIQYKNGQPCAPCSFRKSLEKAQRKYESITHEDIAFQEITRDVDLVREQLGPGREHYSIQSVPALFDPAVDYLHLSPEQTKAIFDDGYHSMNCRRRVFRVDVAAYLAERTKEGDNLTAIERTVQGISKI